MRTIDNKMEHGKNQFRDVIGFRKCCLMPFVRRQSLFVSGSLL